MTIFIRPSIKIKHECAKKFIILVHLYHRYIFMPQTATWNFFKINAEKLVINIKEFINCLLHRKVFSYFLLINVKMSFFIAIFKISKIPWLNFTFFGENNRFW